MSSDSHSGTMTAVGFHEHGDIDQPELLDGPVPEVEPDEVLVDVAATALNHQDLFAVRELDHYITDYPFWGGGDTWVPSMRSLRPGGTLVTSGATAGPNPETEIRLVFMRQLEVVGSTSHSHTDFTRMLEKVWAGDIEPVVQATYPLEDFEQAFEKMANRDVYGKLVLTQ